MEHEFYGVIATAAGFTKYLVGDVYWVLCTKSETSTPYESRNEKGASIKNADKVTKHSCVSALFILARWDAEVVRGRNELEEREDRHRENSKLSDGTKIRQIIYTF